MIKKVYFHPNSTRFYITTSSVDCSPVSILVKKEKTGTCRIGSIIHATGMLTVPHNGYSYDGWGLNDKNTGKDLEYNSAFTCK